MSKDTGAKLKGSQWPNLEQSKQHKKSGSNRL